MSVLSLGTAGCLAQGGVSGRMEASADPMLVEINPGIWVIEDYSEPVFYVEGYYWLYRDNVWFRSSYHTHGWARVQSVPQVIVRIERPTTYVRYRAAPGVRVRSGPRGTVIVRDHRTPPRGQPSETRDRTPRAEDPRPHPVDRPRVNPPEDHRDKRAQQGEDKQDKREDKQDKREDKQDKRTDKDKDKRTEKPGDQRDQHKHP